MAAKVVVVIEDSLDIAALEQEILTSHGAEVRLITEQFQRVFEAKTWIGVQVAVVDLMLPTLTGEEICQYLAIEHPDIRRVICSAKPLYLVHKLQGLAHAVLQKPFTPDVLIAAVFE